MKTQKINNSILITDDKDDIVLNDYYNYCKNLIIKYLEETETDLKIVFGNLYPDSNSINICLQIEHTIVKNSVQDNHFKPESGLKDYNIRIQDFNKLNYFDYIIEYSQPNLTHIKSNPELKNYLDKNILIHPIIYDDLYQENNSRNGIITSFINLQIPRRFKISNELKKFDYLNIICFDKECLSKIYREHKILVNIHQTDFHHTFEELRVLPALMNGIIIISEDVPYKNEIPYSEHIVWSDYHNIMQVVEDVYNNYDYYYRKIFNNKLENIINGMKEANIYNMKKINM